MLKPSPLKPGSTIGIISPSYWLEEEVLERTIIMFKNNGYKIKLGQTVPLKDGPESLYLKIGATMYGFTETTFYVLAVYFGSVGIPRSRLALAARLIADAVDVFSAVYICRYLFG